MNNYYYDYSSLFVRFELFEKNNTQTKKTKAPSLDNFDLWVCERSLGKLYEPSNEIFKLNFVSYHIKKSSEYKISSRSVRWHIPTYTPTFDMKESQKKKLKRQIKEAAYYLSAKEMQDILNEEKFKELLI